MDGVIVGFPTDVLKDGVIVGPVDGSIEGSKFCTIGNTEGRFVEGLVAGSIVGKNDGEFDDNTEGKDDEGFADGINE